MIETSASGGAEDLSCSLAMTVATVINTQPTWRTHHHYHFVVWTLDDSYWAHGLCSCPRSCLCRSLPLGILARVLT